MAKISSPIQIKGSIGDLTFSGTQNGGTRAYMKPTFNKRKWAKSKRKTLAGFNAMEFGGAAMCGSQIYKRLRGAQEDRELFAPYSHNRIAHRLRRHADRSKGFCAHYHFAAAIPALVGLDLSPKGSPSKAISVLPIGPGHAPQSIRIQGLRAAADQIAHAGTDQLECRVSIRHAAFPEAKFDEQLFQWKQVDHPPMRAATKTLWMPIDIIPAEGIVLPAHSAGHSDDQHPILHFVMIEWRTLSAKRKPKLLKGHTIIRYAAATIPQAVLQALPKLALAQMTTPSNTANRRYRHPKKSPGKTTSHLRKSRPSLRKTYPKLFLKIAVPI